MTSAIHLRLPPEILMEIFAQVQPASRKDIWLMHVCQTWRLLLTKTPEFWACMFSALTSSKGLTFNPRSTPEWLNMLFDHSAPCSLPLTIHQFSLAASDTLVRHAYHICSLHVQIASKVVVPFYTMLKHGFPRLESLRMTHVASTTSISPTMFAAFRAIDYSDLVLPLLRTLRLPPVFLTSGLSVDSLRLVEVESCACSECRQPAPAIQRITTDMISSFLQRCPSLQTLRFVGLGYISTSVTAPSPPVERVVLGSLDALDITSYDIPGTANVLDCITLSLRTSVTLDLPDMGAFEPKLQTVLRNLPVFSTTLPHLRLVVHLCTATKPFRLQYFLPDGSSPLALSERRSSPSHRLSDCVARAREVLAMLPLTSVTTLEMRNIPSQVLGKGPQAAVFLQDILVTLPRLATLTLDLTSDAVLSSLTPVLQSTAEGAGVICPMLQTLTLRWCVPSEHDADVFLANCNRIKAALDARAKLGSRLSTFSFKCARISRLEGPAKQEKELLRKHLEEVFATTADQVTVEVYKKGIATN
ncbi:hypothetical protein VTO73DRAFT_11002 [Trametes versicolor]